MKQYDTFFDLITAAASTFAMTQAKAMLLSKEKKQEAMKAAFVPFINSHNIGLLINPSTVGKLKTAIINGLPNLPEHYVFHTEPTADRKDLFYTIGTRANGTAERSAQIASGYLSEITAEQITLIISKFLPNAGTASAAAING